MHCALRHWETVQIVNSLRLYVEECFIELFSSYGYLFLLFSPCVYQLKQGKYSFADLTLSSRLVRSSLTAFQCFGLSHAHSRAERDHCTELKVEERRAGWSWLTRFLPHLCNQRCFGRCLYTNSYVHSVATLALMHS